mmetsp:Transcript_8429/g.9921  ORF Transcript_8429/g.9921 Transcript_8429/m.9921 type:complete len:122 (+) Transcript_8429:16-381(+)
MHALAKLTKSSILAGRKGRIEMAGDWLLRLCFCIFIITVCGNEITTGYVSQSPKGATASFLQSTEAVHDEYSSNTVETRSRRNIMFIMTDQMRYDARSDTITPNLNRLGREGAEFINGYDT